jgi:hypothetical protein
MVDKNKINAKTYDVLMRAKSDPVFFVENFLINKKGDKYTLEDQQKAFLRDPYPYKIFFCSRRSGKSLSIEGDMLHKAFFRKNQFIAAVFPTSTQAKEFANNFNDIVFRSPMLQSSFVIDNKMDKQLSNGTRISFATAGTSSGKKEDSSLVGSSVNTLYLDETQSLDPDSLSTIIPIATGQESRLELVFSGTPRGRQGFFYDNIQNSKYLTDVVQGVTKQLVNPLGKFSLHKFQITDVDENDNVAYSRAEYRLPIDELETVKSVIGVDKFKREYCLSFQDDLSIPYYQNLLDKHGIIEEPPIFGSKRLCCGGVDFGKHRNNSVLTIGELTPQMQWDIKFFKAWELGTTYKEITHFINKILPVKFPNMLKVAVDATGVGSAIVESLDEHNRFEVMEVLFSQPKKVMLVETAVSNLEEDLINFYPHKKLMTEFSEYRREISDSGKIVFKKGASDDFIDSYNLCNLAITSAMQDGLNSNRQRIRSYSLGGQALNNKNKTYNSNIASLKNARTRFRR